ncbi:hypothetical protein H2201_002901 [Coniosporium apollinis]|uniref:CBM21 domain-containing protein n=1 Tax=Coniosporium apollinis TaxID=61459 RepID=A0ABQ9NXE8_9PEZI|nr:hypothetical protein H2201_002901 [Coniosporium apollinis]
MPYTPPAQRSPATSSPNSPTLSRTHSYASEKPGLSPSLAQRPVLPRSVSSTSYLSKHRRSPSLPRNNGNSEDMKSSSEGPSNKASSSNGSVRQSPPPVSTQLIPPGAITTPPDSAEGSDTEERGRQLEELQRNLHNNIEVKRGHSPVRGEDEAKTAASTSSVPDSTPIMGPALTPEARKISHSRSASELTPVTTHNNIHESPVQTTDDSDDDDSDNSKPPLLRKKSGELVKPALRPPSRRRPSSMPGTPTYNKAVHFNEDIEQVRHFLQVDRPIAVSAGSSPVETYDSESEYPFGYDDGHASKVVEWEIRLANFPVETYERKSMPVRLEQIFLSADNKTLIGNVAVANLAFQKLVVARFTLDYWKTTSEVVAEFNNDVRKKEINDGYDRFNFSIRLSDLAHLESKTMLLCIRYNVNGQEYWDNNAFTNFQIDFIKKTRPRKGAKQGPVAGTLGAIPRSRHSPPSRQRTAPASFEDDFGDGWDSRYDFGSTKSILGESPNTSIRLKNNRNKRGSLFPGSAPNGTTGPNQAFSSRYDFGASLSAALTQAQSTLGERSGLKLKAAPKPKRGYFDNMPNSISQPADPASMDNTPPPSALASDKPDLKSDQYKELIQKYCFFGTGKNSPQVSSPKPQPDSAPDNDSDSSPSSNEGSGSSSPNFQKEAAPLDRAHDSEGSSRSVSPFLSRSASPGPLTGSDIGFRATSPASFGYPYNHQSTHNSMFSETQAPTAISG